MSERELQAVTEAMFGYPHDWSGWGDDDRESATKYAQAAISASDSQYIKGLVEALNSIAKNTCCDKCQEAALVARAALQNLPEDLR